MEAEKLVSLRAFGRMTGTSDGAVRKAITRGDIKDGISGEGKSARISPTIAAAEWGKEIIADEHGNPIEPDETNSFFVDERGDIIEDDDFFGDESDDTDDVAEIGDTVADEAAVDAKDLPELDSMIKLSTTKVEAERYKAIYSARKAQRELQKLEGELVDRGLVFQNLFEFAIQLKEVILNVPDRVIDNLLAADSRNEALILLNKELSDALRSLAQIGDIDITKEK